MSLQESHSHIPIKDLVPSVHTHFSWHVLIPLAALQIVPWLVVAALLAGPKLHPNIAPLLPLESNSGSPAAVTRGKPGPWGDLEYLRIGIELPDEFVYLPGADQPPIRWYFGGYSKDRVVEFLKSVDLAPAQLDTLIEKSAWTTETAGTAVAPDDDLILGLSPAARSKIYTLLGSFPENGKQIDPVWFRPDTLGQQLDGSGLSYSSRQLLRRLLYPGGPSLLLFTDYEPALRALPDDDERRRLLKLLHAKSTLMARLKINSTSNVESLASYWGVGGRRKDLVPLLESLRRVDAGTKLNIVYLLPHFMRDHLYNHPYPAAGPEEPKQDCFWSAMNALNIQPDDRFNDMQYVQQVLERDYYNILDPSQLGDLIFLTNGANAAIHAAVYVADDIVFTKNGDHFTQPWILMHMSDMVDTYAVRFPGNGPLKAIYYRKKVL